MKFVVDALPEQKDCPFSEWHPYPPIMEEPGYYRCKLAEVRNDGCYMDRENGECEFLVEMRKVR
jgi:hypothetical protein